MCSTPPLHGRHTVVIEPSLSDSEEEEGGGGQAEGSTVFRGRYRDGERHGRGTLTFPDGSSLCGIYRHDELHGEAVCRVTLRSTLFPFLFLRSLVSWGIVPGCV